MFPPPPGEVGMRPNPVGSFKPVKEFGPNTGKQARIPGGGGSSYQRREGRKSVPGRGNSRSKDPEKGKELQCSHSGLSGGERCELRPVRLAGDSPCRGSNTRLRCFSCVPWTLEAMVVSNREGADQICALGRLSDYIKRGQDWRQRSGRIPTYPLSQPLLCPHLGPVHHSGSPQLCSGFLPGLPATTPVPHSLSYIGSQRDPVNI